MKDEITGLMVIYLGIFIFIKRDNLVNTLLKQKKFGEEKPGFPNTISCLAKVILES